MLPDDLIILVMFVASAVVAGGGGAWFHARGLRTTLWPWERA